MEKNKLIGVLSSSALNLIMVLTFIIVCYISLVHDIIVPQNIYITIYTVCPFLSLCLLLYYEKDKSVKKLFLIVFGITNSALLIIPRTIGVNYHCANMTCLEFYKLSTLISPYYFAIMILSALVAVIMNMCVLRRLLKNN